MTETSQTTPERFEQIMQAAFNVFLTYGYKKTSMADIAEGTGLSRAALYLHFRNKDDIFGQLVARFYADTATRMEAALAGEGDHEALLRAAFAAKIATPFDEVFQKAHGAELLDVKGRVAPEIIEAGNAQIRSVLTVWLAGEAKAGRIDMAPLGGSARAVAETMLAASHGVMDEAEDYVALAADFDRLAVTFARALAA